MPIPRSLPAEQLRWTVPSDLLRFETTAELKPLEGVVGQSSALEALKRGVEMRSAGFNVFVVGLLPTGRLGTVKRILDEIAPRRRSTRDLVYVRNFSEPARPRLLTFAPRRGVAFRKELIRVAGVLLEEVPRILRSDQVRRARDREQQAAAVTHHGALARVEEHAQELGFTIGDVGDDDQARPTVLWIDPAPRGGEPAQLHDRAELQVLAEAGRVALPIPLAEIDRRFELLDEELADAMEASHEAVTETVRRVNEAEQSAIREGTRKLFADLARRWPVAKSFLSDLHDQIVDAPEWFDEEATDEDALFQAFTVNVIHQGSRSIRAPVIVASNPTWQNLLGGIEGEPGGTDHRSIRAGALVDADGGFLVVNVADLLQEPGAWKVLKRALTFGDFDISNPDVPVVAGLVMLRPDSIRLDVKVILLGDASLYAMLFYGDPDFASIFKIKAEFEEDAPCTPALVEQIALFFARLIRKEKLPHMTRAAVILAIGWAVRHAGRGGRISTRFGTMADLVREATYESEGRLIERVHMEAALRARRTRDDLAERRVLELIERGIIRVVVSGERVGQVNGLAVYHVGGHDFGRPLRITATVGVGRTGILNIEREVGLSGKAHDKGVQILGGIVRERFGKRRTLAFTASLCFEQSYGKIDGDSASSAEAYVLFSALSGVPLRQDIAVTGSVNQVGEIQSIGGVNEKIEGFFQACRTIGLTGTQGVVIPWANIPDLCLAQDVADACAAGRFHVWAVQHLEEGLELLTGTSAGEEVTEGEWSEGSLFARVAATLDRFQEVARLQGRRVAER
jgi:predicted ATP-dependent protease